MNAARVKRKRAAGERGPALGGIEAARSAMSVLRHMFSWAMDEGTLKRKDNPVSKITKNLPNKSQGDVVLSTNEARIVWQAAQETGYPSGTHVQLMLLTGCRLDDSIQQFFDQHAGPSASRRWRASWVCTTTGCCRFCGDGRVHPGAPATQRHEDEPTGPLRRPAQKRMRIWPRVPTLRCVSATRIRLHGDSPILRTEPLVETSSPFVRLHHP